MSLRIHKLRNAFVMPRDLPGREQVCARMESSVDRSGVDALGKQLDELLDPADPSVWIIRKLKVSFAISEPADAGRLWARGIAAGIRRQLQQGGDGQNVLRFPDRAAYWAWFLRDLAAGSPPRWWHAGLESLRYLGFGAACVTLLSREPELSAAVLSYIDESGGWRELIEKLSEEQAGRLLEWTAGTEELPPPEILAVAIGTWIETRLAAATPARHRLSSVVRLVRLYPGAARGAVRGAVEMMSEAEETFRLVGREAWVWMAAAEWTGRQVYATPALPSRVRLLLKLAPRESLEELTRVWEHGAMSKRPSSGATFTTEFGGWFLLLPSYLAVDVEGLVSNGGEPEEATPESSRAFRWLMARMCLGPRGRNANPADEALLWVSGLEEPPRAENLPWPVAARVEEWLAEQGLDAEVDAEYFGSAPIEQAWARVASAVVRHFAGRLPGFAKSGPAHLDANLFEGRASLRVFPGAAEVTLSRRPLDILLRMGGLDGESYSLPWKDHTTINIRLD